MTIVPYLEWAINAAAVERLKDFYLLHAGVVAHGDRALVLPAASGSGKTTLIAALLAAGFGYLSDEIAVVDPSTGHLLPFAKSLYVREGSRSVLAPLYPELRAAARFQQTDAQPIWYLCPRNEWLPPAAVPLSHVILPTYEPGAATRLSRVGRSDVLKRFLEQSFNLRDHGASGVGGLVRLLQSAECYELTYGHLDEAIAAITGAIS